ncbi:MAG: hypothetical protein KME64_41400 [Scytonematopsis contorta HA4267-MV1]|jgi:hypothetical protein|nr:hypothetical protein [Scytonematopsis contorta HA4267-MV1]
MNAADILGNVDIENMSIATKANLVRDMMKYLNITDEDIEDYKNSQLDNKDYDKEQKEAASNFSSVIKEITNVEQQIVDKTLFHYNQLEAAITQTQDNNPQESNDNKNSNNSSNSNTEQSKEEKQIQIVTNDDVKKFVIPVVVERIVTHGKETKEGIIYESEDYNATLKLDKDSQMLSLDRNSDTVEEALLASKNNNDNSYTIVINNLTQEEFERFKALFLEQKIRQEQSKLTENKPINELD